MEFYFAPMEGITGYIYRNAHAACFGGMEKYFTPFIAPGEKSGLSSKERNDVLPQHNEKIRAVPQILTNNAAYFLQTARALKEMGYDEVNLNLGCPSRTVVAKGRGAGFLAHPDELFEFLDTVFTQAPCKISVKTRLGIEDAGEFQRLLEIFGQFPISELIVHPRLQKDYYKNKPDWEAFKLAVEKSSCPVCYNGDLFSREDYEAFANEFPGVQKVMMGRGLLKNPGLVRSIQQKAPLEKEQVREFHDRIFREYQEVLFGEKPVLFKMKELWSYMITVFSNHEKYWKKIKKAERLYKYEDTVNALFREEDITE